MSQRGEELDTKTPHFESRRVENLVEPFLESDMEGRGAAEGGWIGLRVGQNSVVFRPIVRGVVITGGKAPQTFVVLRWCGSAGLVVAADSGLETAIRCGLQPDLVVGDFDSLETPELLSNFRESQIERYPCDKDETDTEIAIRVCRERGADEIVIIGGGGGQMAHFVGILSLFDRPDPPSVWITDSAEFTCIAGSIAITGAVGDIVGFFPVGCEPCEMRSRGLRWSLDSVVWNKGDIGVSNELSDTRAEVHMERGRLLMIRDLEA